MNELFLRIKGVASYKVQQRLTKDLGYIVKEPFSKFLFFSYSEFVIPLNTTFFYLCEDGFKQYAFFCKIIMATQGWNLYYDPIPYGHKSVCHVVFDEHSYNLISLKIPVVDTWTTIKSEFILSIAPCSAPSFEISR